MAQLGHGLSWTGAAATEWEKRRLNFLRPNHSDVRVLCRDGFVRRLAVAGTVGGELFNLARYLLEQQADPGHIVDILVGQRHGDDLAVASV